MLKLKNITKTYETDGVEDVQALKGIDINFRKSEFVSILGQSGCGKTTLLNIIGGLDRYTTGDLVINGKSTKNYKDKDWDAYRNYSVGFVFQSYNLIPHQSVLANVELSLTISGYNAKQKRQKAIDALESVGLGDQIHKRPSQLSGGQMQRVAIARAIVNDPDIILADEPTGALDTKTSTQIMDLLKEISKDKLIIMVTHNPEIAEKYSTRIVRLVDGKVTDDTNPYNEEEKEEESKYANKKTHMSFITALKLSLNNLMTKKGRTILTAFAGSIGIIGIALILSLSSGVNKYIEDIQKETMLSYPIEIEATSMDLSSILGDTSFYELNEADHENDAVYSDVKGIERVSKVSMTLSKNNLTDFKKYLDNKESRIHEYLGENGVVYSYSTNFDLYSYDPDGKLVNADGSTFETKNNASMAITMASGFTSSASASMDTSNIIDEIMPGTTEEEIISPAFINEYELIEGKYPQQYNEVVIVLDKNNEISATTLYNLGLLPSKEYKDIIKKLEADEAVETQKQKISYEDILNKTFKIIPSCDYYIKKDNGLFENVKDSSGKVEELLKSATELKVVGIIKQKEESKNALISSTLGYTKLLTNYIIDHTNNSEVIKAQEADSSKNVINGLQFKISTDDEKVEEAKKYLRNLSITEKAQFASAIMIQSADPMMQSQMMYLSESQLASFIDSYVDNPDRDLMIKFYDDTISPGTYEDNMKSFGKVSYDTPSKIQIYADTFEAKDGITECINEYNNTVEEEDKITFTDFVGLLMKSVTTIINAISYVLIAFVSISLIVSSIMIAIITYISVLERTKEIGILRAMGTSKKDVSKIFNAETFIEGFVAGVLGIVVTMLLNIPIGKIIHAITDTDMKPVLPLGGAIALVIISVILTVIAGLVPSKIAAKKDPAVVLRSE